MFDFKVSRSGDDTISELTSDDILYCFYTSSTRVAVEINAYVVNTRGTGILRRDYMPMFQNFFWGGPYTVMFAGAK